MLPPQLRQGLVLAQRQSLASTALKASSTALLRATFTHHQSRRHFWNWRRRSDDWASHLDPNYHRFCRYRTLKTRAKLLKNLRRKGKFNWDFESKPFFTPQLVRWASHWDGKDRGRSWYLSEEAKKDREEDEAVKKAEEDGFELSAREKEWKEKMEAMRRRIEKDPYEAIFGKRFEPFWSPLVPSWMREEMGLQGWPKPREAVVKASVPEKQSIKVVKNETGDKAKPKDSEPAKKPDASVQVKAKSEPTATTSKPSSYSYATSTSWDSWTNKTKRVEWDSASGQTRKYEYDPISNRMVQVEAPKPTAVTENKTKTEASEFQEKVDSLRGHLQETVQGLKSRIETQDAAKAPSVSKAINIPVKRSKDVRKSIPIPPPLSQPSHSLALGWSRTAGTSIGPLKITAVSASVPKPAALSKIPEKKDLDSLTPEQVRASMGKTKPSVAESQPVVTLEEATIGISVPIELDAAKPKSQIPKNSQWDQAEMSVMLDKELESLQKKKDKLVKDERGLFHIERQKRELQKLDDRIKEVIARVDKLNLDIALPKPKTEVSKTNANTSMSLQSSVDRMQSKELPKIITEPDDSAAHESTEPISTPTTVPKNWTQQAELLQSDRIRRTASKVPCTKPMARWMDDMNARKAAYEANRVSEKSAAAAADSQQQSKLERANAMLEAEVKEQKFRMQAHENRYAHKIRGLRQELETAYKQSTVHSEKHLERIRYLEEELRKVTKAAGSTSGPMKPKVAVEVSEAQKRKEAEKKEQKLKDRELVKEVREIYESAYGVIDAHHKQPTLSVRTEQAAVAQETKKTPQVVEVESDVDLGEALAKYEGETSPYAFKDSSLENEIQARERQYYEDQGPLFKTKSSTAEPEAKLVDDNMPKLIPTELAKPEATSEKITEPVQDAVASSGAGTIAWEDPPVYKVLAYDSGNDMMSTATTTSNFTGTEAPISIPQALSQLYNPARFVPYFAELQKDGYQVIFGTSDLLVFKKVKANNRIGLEDHGVASMLEPRPLLERAVATELKHDSSVNPIDGTSRTVRTEPFTGNFASPTGFVNHDPIFSAEQSGKMTASESKPATKDSRQEQFEGFEEENGEDIEYRHYPRVRRMEQHFTGARRMWNNAHRRHKRAEQRQRDSPRRPHPSTTSWVLGVGLTSAAVAYLIGTASQRARISKEEDWARKAEEQRRKWRSY